ncbi:Retinoblastoma-like protein 1 [Lamellibrachia satsuma]|nr:Retinoblastoma-like protein 1 [Lamellibrachia satsuma]
MGLSDDSDEQRFEELCLDLNMDKNAKDEAAQAFERMRRNYTLEGNTLHWLACALYVSGRRNVPTVEGRVAPGNYVSLTRLLRSGKLSLIEFFKKIKKWADMANLPQEFRDRIDRLERNFAVSTVIFKKYRPIFMDIFRNPADCPVRPPRGRKQRRLPCSAEEVFKFCWTMFVMVKGNFPALSDDLVNSYHLLLCCIDWFYTNSLMSNRRDLLNPEFSGLPQKFNDRDYKSPTDVPCVVQLLCDKYEGLVIEAKGIKEHWWKPYIRKLFRREILKGKSENLTGVLDIGNFEANSKTVSHEYEEYVLNRGDFDERIFLGVDANTEIGTPAKLCPAVVGDLTEKIQVSKNLWQSYDETRSLAPSTPLTGRHYLKDREAPITPVSTATQSVSRLHSMLSGRKTCPSETLVEIFNECTRNPKDEILKRVKDMGEVFCRKYVTL